MNVVLIGYRGTGKTSVGKRLAGKLHVSFYDTDEIVETAAGRSIKEMVREKGWEYFRKREKDAVRDAASQERDVIATGGGAVMDAENADILKKNGILIWLFADARTIVGRIENDSRSCTQRPSLSGGDLLQETIHILEEREPVYRRLADFSVDTTARGIDETVDEICRFLIK